MKTITIHIVRVMLLLTLYVCCSSVVCCEASKTEVMESSSEKMSRSIEYNKQTFDEDLTPIRLISIRLTELL
ncbi:hypothetical protein BH10BAC2_BH10BAC2_36630 [soil metagenome]